MDINSRANQPNQPPSPQAAGAPAPRNPQSPTPYSAPEPKRRLPHLHGGKRTDGDDEGPSRFHSIFSTILLFGTAFLIAILLNTFVIQSYQVDGESMETTLQNNDRLIVNKIPRTLSRLDGHQYVPHRGDIIIFNQDSLPGFVGEKQLIKRVIALPGERVVVSNGKVKVYNNSYPNGFNPDKITGYHIAADFTSQDIDQTLQNNELFVMGDNRGNSEDSRFFGPIKTNAVVAKLVLRILPLNKIKTY